MTNTNGYTLPMFALATRAFPVVSPAVKPFQLLAKGQRGIEAFRRRIAARYATHVNLPAAHDGMPDPPEET